MAHQPEAGPNRNSGGADAGLAPADEVTTGNPYHLSRGTRRLLRLVAVTLVVSMTALFLRGFINS